MTREIEIYISWARGLPQDGRALALLKKSGVAGVEMLNTDDQFEMVQRAGLKVSLHAPRVLSNLADPNYINAFDGAEGARLLHVIRASDAPTVGFHLGYDAGKVQLMILYPDVPLDDTRITDRAALLRRITGNVVLLERKINDCTKKQVVLETMVYHRKKPISWKNQLPEARAKQEIIEHTIVELGTNAGVNYVTDIPFIRDVLSQTESVGFLFDVGHVFISAQGRIYNGKYHGSVDDYVNEMIGVTDGRTYQMHVSVPFLTPEGDYEDRHCILRPSDGLSDKILDIAGRAISHSPHLQVVTLEMKTGLDSYEHAEEMVRQVQYLKGRLRI